MKQTAIQISMINNINTRNKHDEQRMTSLEIAQLTGKPHNDVLKAIRKMEPAWEKVCQGKFSLTSRTISQPNGGTRVVPCYLLTKTETLYIATKFNDEARARLVLRWEELERAHRGQTLCNPLRYSQQGQSPCALLGSDEAVLNEADEILGEELDELNRYSDHCYTPTDIGKPFGLEGRDLNSFLADQGIIRWARGQWMLTPKYQHQGLTENRCFFYHGRNGRRKMESRLVWTEEGRQFINEILRG